MTITDFCKGRVIVSQRSEAIVEDIDGRLMTCKRKKGLGRPLCGDIVEWFEVNDREGIIDKIQSRKNVLERPDSRGKIKAIAANIDQMIIVCAPLPKIQTELIDRYITAAINLNIPPLLVINKADILQGEEQEFISSIAEDYRKIGINLQQTSIKTGAGIDGLEQAVFGSVNILVGQSGVGKSSIIKHLIPDLEIRIGRISDYSGEGKHTTTETTLYRIGETGAVIDSPGVRAFRLYNLQEEAIVRGFPEFADYSDNCRYHNCRHVNEPGCAVIEAVEHSLIPETRLQSYHKIIDSVKGRY